MLAKAIRGGRVNWAEELRAMRARAGLTQSGMADLLGISQPHISRIEAGEAQPHPDLIERIDVFRDAPQSRGVLAGILATVRRSPHVSCILGAAETGLVYVAISAGFRAHPQFQDDAEGQPIRPEVSPGGTERIERLAATGILEGKVDAVETLWITRLGDAEYCWKSMHTPIRTDSGIRHIYCALNPITRQEHDRLDAAWNGLRVISLADVKA